MESHLKMFLYRRRCGIIYPMSMMENVFQENAYLKQELAAAKNISAEMKEQLDWFKKQVFGAKSERLVDDESDQLKFPGMEILKPEEQEEVEIKGHIRKKELKKNQKSNFLMIFPKSRSF